LGDRKWFAINLIAPAERSAKEDLLLKVFDDIISKFKDDIESWHFLWESLPYPHTLLLRFYGKSCDIDRLKVTFGDYLDRENVERIPNNTYDGEAASYGVKGWTYVMNILHLGADFAIDLIKNERVRNTNDFPKSFSCYIDRWIHIFLNQLSTSVAEHKVLFYLHAHRYVINRVGEERYRQIASDLEEAMPSLMDASTRKLDDFVIRKAQERGWSS